MPTWDSDCSKFSRALRATTSKRPEAAIAGPASALGVERGDAAGQGLDRPAADLPAPEPLAERGLVGQALHLHGPLDDLAAALHLDTRAVEGHGDDPQVDRRRQPAVEPDLLLAEVAAPLRRAEVEEPQGERLLDLVGMGPARKTTEMCVWRTSTASTGCERG